MSVNTIHTIIDDAVPTINPGSVDFSHNPFPEGADWVFEWITQERGTVELDEVELDLGGYYQGNYCWAGPDLTLAWGDPDVEMSIIPVAGVGWLHQVIWNDRDCYGAEICDFQFRVRSSVGTQTPEESSWVSFGEFDVCITKIILGM